MATLPQNPPPVQEKNKPEVETKTLLAWRAPARPFKRRSREFFSTAMAIAFLVSVILIFIKEWFLIIVIIALLFFIFIISTTPPEEIEHKITNKGVVTSGKNYNWDQLASFWFSQQWDQKILNIRSPFQFPGRLMLLLGEQNEGTIKKVLARFLDFEEPSPTSIDKAGDWLVKKVPLEKSS